MGLNVKNTKKASLPPIEAGTYTAVCVGVVDLGEQYSEKFKKYNDKILLVWELIGVSVEVDGEKKPRWLSKDFTASLGEKSNLSKFLVPWRGKAFTEDELNGNGFELVEMLRLGCFMQVIVEERDGNCYNRITSVMAMPTGMPQPTTETKLFAFDMDNWDDSVFVELPQWVQERIQKSTQYAKAHASTESLDFPDAKVPEEVPF